MRFQARLNNQRVNLNIDGGKRQIIISTNQNLARAYIRAIREGSIKLEDVPVSLKKAVQKQLGSI